MGKPKTAEHKEKIRQALLARGVGAADKKCPGCHETLPREAFGTRKNGFSRSRCRKCDAKSSRDWFHRNPEKARALMQRTNLWRHYSMTPEQYDALSDAQGGVCAICKSPPESVMRGRLYVDHCRDTNLIRGLLCGQCNSGIGSLRHSLELLATAIQYLANPPSRGKLMAKSGMPSGRC